MPQQLSHPAEVQTVDDEVHLEFIEGFPCEHGRCHGTLTEGRYDGRPAVVCSMCEETYYALEAGE